MLTLATNICVHSLTANKLNNELLSLAGKGVLKVLQTSSAGASLVTSNPAIFCKSERCGDLLYVNSSMHDYISGFAVVASTMELDRIRNAVNQSKLPLAGEDLSNLLRAGRLWYWSRHEAIAAIAIYKVIAVDTVLITALCALPTTECELCLTELVACLHENLGTRYPNLYIYCSRSEVKNTLLSSSDNLDISMVDSLWNIIFLGVNTDGLL